jgi:DnaJ-class molecular chaperone
MPAKKKPRMCLKCLGYGRITVKRKWEICPDCNGSGAAPERESKP